MTKKSSSLRVGLIVPHIFMQRAVLPHVIFSPGELAIELAQQLDSQGVSVTLFSPGPVDTTVNNITSDLTLFEQELAARGDSYIDLLRKHPATFIALARQVQAELIANAFSMANNNHFDILHIYTNEEDIALPFVQFCHKPVALTHHDPFNFLVRYKNNLPKYKHLNWIALSEAQKKGMPEDTNWVSTIYHGLNTTRFKPVTNPTNDYVAFMGRIVEPKGLHLAIDAVNHYNQDGGAKLKLKIAGKHYSGHSKDKYWTNEIEPKLGGSIEYVGHIRSDKQKNLFLGNAKALIVPSTFEEPFGMVVIEAMACGTPVVGIKSGAIPELIEHGVTGLLVDKAELPESIAKVDTLDRRTCRDRFEARFSAERMASEYLDAYWKLLNNH